MSTTKGRVEAGPLMNEKIRFDKIQVITHDGSNEGVISRDMALRLAREAGLDLVIIAEMGKEGFPVAKIMDYGKVLYEKKKQLADAKKKQHVIQVKELKMRPKIGEHDFLTKMNQAIGFLKEGKRVKFTLIFRGREITMKRERGSEMLEKIQSVLSSSEVAPHLAADKDMMTDNMWTRVYYLKK